MDKIGLRLSAPDQCAIDSTDDYLVEMVIDEPNGMEYVFYPTDSDYYGILAASHEDVGQVTYYRITRNEWRDNFYPLV